VEEKWVSVLSVVCGRNEWRQASWRVRVISVELNCFASRQPVSAMQIPASRWQSLVAKARKGCVCAFVCACVCGDMTVGRLSL
jgi:hypothetical protein